LIKKIISFLGNVKLGVVYLILLAILSVLGSTYIKQGETYITYYKEYGEIPAKIIWITWLNNVFHAWYYQLLIVLVAIAVIFATIERFPSIYRTAYGKVEKKMPEGVLKKPSTIKLSFNESIDEALQKIVSFIHNLGFRKVEVIKEENAVYLFAEKGKVSRLAMLVTHIGIIVFLIGAFLGSYFGVRGQIEIPESEKADYIRKYREGSLKPGDEIYKLPFEIKMDKFWLDFYDSKEFSGAVKSYNSEIEILEDGKSVMKKVIKVNEPAEYKGYRIFQTSYGKTGEVKKASIVAVKYDELIKYIEESQILNQKLASESDEDKKREIEKQLRDLDRRFYEFFNKAKRINYNYNNNIYKFDDAVIQVVNTTLNYKNPMLAQQDVFDPLVVTKVKYKDKEFNMPIGADVTVSIFAYEKFAKSYGFPYLLIIENLQPRYFSGLQISYFPGTNLIWLGTIIVVFGTVLAFYIVHRRIWVKIEDNNGVSNVYIAFYFQKFKESFEAKLKEEVEKLKLHLEK